MAQPSKQLSSKERATLQSIINSLGVAQIRSQIGISQTDLNKLLNPEQDSSMGHVAMVRGMLDDLKL